MPRPRKTVRIRVLIAVDSGRMTYEEAAELTGVSVRTLKTRMKEWKTPSGP